MSSRGAGMYGREQADPGWIAALLVGAVVAAFSLPGVLLGMVLVPVARRRRAAMVVAAVLGAGLTAPVVGGDLRPDGVGARRDPSGRRVLEGPRACGRGRLAAHAALVAGGHRHRPGHRGRRRADPSPQRRGAPRARRAPRRTASGHGASARPAGPSGAPKPERQPAGFELGRHIDGDHLLPTRRGRVTDAARPADAHACSSSARRDRARPRRCCASPRAWPTTTDWSVFVLDAKGDPHTQQRFAALMAPGRPQARGCSRTERLRRLARRRPRDRQPAGAADRLGRRRAAAPTTATSRSTSSALACTAPQGPPRISGELLARLDRRPTQPTSGPATDAQPEALAGFKAEHVDACRQRYAAVLRRHRRPARRPLGLRGHRLRLPAPERAALRRGDRQARPAS